MSLRQPLIRMARIWTRCCCPKRSRQDAALTKTADLLAAIFLGMYSKENEKSWAGKNKEGLKRFLEDKFVCQWEGFAVWDAGNGTVDCYF